MRFSGNPEGREGPAPPPEGGGGKGEGGPPGKRGGEGGGGAARGGGEQIPFCPVHFPSSRSNIVTVAPFPDFRDEDFVPFDSVHGVEFAHSKAVQVLTASHTVQPLDVGAGTRRVCGVRLKGWNRTRLNSRPG